MKQKTTNEKANEAANEALTLLQISTNEALLQSLTNEAEEYHQMAARTTSTNTGLQSIFSQKKAAAGTSKALSFGSAAGCAEAGSFASAVAREAVARVFIVDDERTKNGRRLCSAGRKWAQTLFRRPKKEIVCSRNPKWLFR